MAIFGNDPQFMTDIARAMLSSKLPPTQEEQLLIRTMWLPADQAELQRLRDAELRYESSWAETQKTMTAANIQPTDTTWVDAAARHKSRMDSLQADIKLLQDRIKGLNARLAMAAPA